MSQGIWAMQEHATKSGTRCSILCDTVPHLWTENPSVLDFWSGHNYGIVMSERAPSRWPGVRTVYGLAPLQNPVQAASAGEENSLFAARCVCVQERCCSAR